MTEGIPHYDTTEVRIRQCLAEDAYTVEIDTARHGTASSTITLPKNLTAGDLTAVEATVGITSADINAAELLSENQAYRYGRALFDSVFTDKVADLYRKSRDQSEPGLRIVLRLPSDDLHALPWELLHDGQDWLFLTTTKTLIRYIEMAAPLRSIKVDPPLQVLAVNVGVRGICEDEAEGDSAPVLIDLERRGLIELCCLSNPTTTELKRELRRQPWNIFHFDGHGAFDRTTNENFLVLARNQRLPSKDLARTLSDRKGSLRVVVLNACEGATSAVGGPTNSMAVELTRAGIPAVLAMQYKIEDRAAEVFATAFYERIADFWPVDAAVSSARAAMVDIEHTLQWAVPVLYLRVQRPIDGFLFTPGELADEAAVFRQVDSFERSARAELNNEKPLRAAALVTKAIAAYPNHAAFYELRSQARRDAEDLGGAMSDLTEAVRLAPDNLIYRKERVALLRESGQFAQATVDLSHLIEADPENPELYYQRGLLHHLASFHAVGTRNYRLAIDDFDRAIGLAKGVFKYQKAKASTLYQLAKERRSYARAKEAVTTLERVVEKDSEDQEARLDLALAQQLAGELPTASYLFWKERRAFRQESRRTLSGLAGVSLAKGTQSGRPEETVRLDIWGHLRLLMRRRR